MRPATPEERALYVCVEPRGPGRYCERRVDYMPDHGFRSSTYAEDKSQFRCAQHAQVVPEDYNK